MKRLTGIILAAMLLLPMVAKAQKTYYDQAVEAYEAGDYLTCIQLVNKQCEEECTLKERWLFMWAAYKGGAYDYAASVALAVANELPKSNGESLSDVYTIIAVALYEHEEYKLSIKSLDKAIKANPESAWAFYERGQTYYAGLKNKKKAKKDLLHAIELDSTYVDAIMLLAYMAENEKDYATAESYYRKAIDLTERKSERRFAEYASGLAVRGDSTKAVDTLLYAMSLPQENGRSGRVYNRFLNICPEHLMQGLKKKVAEEPYKPLWEALLGDCFEEAKQQDSAYHHYYVCHLMEPGFDGGILPSERLVKAYDEAECYEQAEALVNDVLEINPNSKLFLRHLRTLAQEQADYKRAADICNMLLMLDEENTFGITLMRGRYYFEMGEYDLALADVMTALKENPEHTHVNLLLGQIYDKQGRHDEALICYNQVLKQAKGFYDFETGKVLDITNETKYKLGSFDTPRALLYAGKADAAQELVEIMNTKIRNILKMDPEADLKETMLYNLACANSLVGKLEDAVEMLELAAKKGYEKPKYIRIDPDFDNLRNSGDEALKERYETLLNVLMLKNAAKFVRIQKEVVGVTLSDEQRMIK